MSAAEEYLTHEGTPESGPVLGAAPDIIEVRRNGGVAALIALAACGVAIAWFGRAISTGAVVDWVVVAFTGLLGILWLAAFVDARTPLLVADAQGARIRLGRTWIGLPWSAVESVRHSERTSLVRDGRIEVVAHNPERVLAGLTPQAARQARWATRVHGGPLALPLGLGTSLVGSDHTSLGTDLAALAFVDPDVVVRPASETPEAEVVAPRERVSLGERLQPVTARLVEARQRWNDKAAERADERAARREAEAVRQAEEAALREAASVEVDAPVDAGTTPSTTLDDVAVSEGPTAPQDSTAPVVASPTPAPLRQVPPPSRAEVLRVVEAPEPEDAELAIDALADRATEDPRGNVARLRAAGVTPISTEGHAVAPVVIDDFDVEPVLDPVIGPELRAARTRLALSTDQLAERTRIRPHVIEAIEVDDFAPCGGDFYARGHLRTLARVLGVDAGMLLERYDERYAHAPVEARKVFEAELATGSHGSIRGTSGGPNWSVLVVAVMAVVLAWSVVQLIVDRPADEPDTPVLNGSGGPQGGVDVGTPVKVRVSAPEAGAEIVVRDVTGQVVHSGSLAIGERTTVEAVPPVRVQSSDGSVTVRVDGRDRGAVGTPGDPAQGTYAGD